MGQAPHAANQTLRADARRNVEAIRCAALSVFRQNGLNSSLEDVARQAGVSKGTIYHRFRDRIGLIDAVVEDVMNERNVQVQAAVAAVTDPGERMEMYLRTIWLMQFDDPAFNDVLLRSVPESSRLCELCMQACAFAQSLLSDAHAAGAIRLDFTFDDLYQLIWERGVIARACPKQTRENYARMLEFALHGLRA